METFFGLVLLWAAANNSAESLDAVKRTYEATGIQESSRAIPIGDTTAKREGREKLKLAGR